MPTTRRIEVVEVYSSDQVEVEFDDVAEAFSNINSPQELAAFEQTPPR